MLRSRAAKILKWGSGRTPVGRHAIRQLQAGNGSDADVYPTEIKLLKHEKALQVIFSTGETFSYPAELLRVESPAAEAPRDLQGRQKIIHGRRNVGIMGVEPVGSYAIRLQFDDMHGTGIYTWPFLHTLGRHKLSRAREYIRRLRQHGLSRDPPQYSKGRSTFAKADATAAGKGPGTPPQ